MRFLVILLSVSLMTLLLSAAVLFHRDTVCRQKAWQKSFELKTRSLLTDSKTQDWAMIPSCQIQVKRHQEKISWHQLASLKFFTFEVDVQSKL